MVITITTKRYVINSCYNESLKLMASRNKNATRNPERKREREREKQTDR
jgi:hypothetical protein